MTRVALVVMPFAAEDGPALGASLLRAALIRNGVECELMYLNLKFASLLGLARYRAIDSLPSLLLGEWIFAPSVFGDALPPADEYVRDILKEDPLTLDALLALRRTAADFLVAHAEEVDWSRYDVVGFSSSFQQNLASVALARLIRERFPRIRMVMGGANCESDMGLAILEQFPHLDAVASGESDESFPRLIAEWAADRVGTGIPGISVRTPSGIRANSTPRPVTDLDALPIPDFHDFYEQLRESGLDIRPSATHLRMETSRGCWWGERAHCTFCGLNGGTMAFRRKSTPRVLAELAELSRYPTRSVLAADNILDEKGYENLLPELVRGKNRMRLFFEIKSSVTREQVALMSAAGIWRIQPGIESLGTDVLGRMRKGTRGIDNIALLKWSTQEDIALTWNWLCGFPGEHPEDHARMAALLRQLAHLQPPTGLFEVQVHRFAPFHTDPIGRGIGPIRAARPYRHIYALPDDTIERIAYYFERSEAFQPPETIRQLADAITSWRMSATRGDEILIALDSPDATRIRDGRSCRSAATHLLKGFERDLHRACDGARRPEEIAEELNSSTETVLKAAAGLEERGLLLALDGRLLALAVNVPHAEGDPDHQLDVESEISRARAKALFQRGSEGMP